MSYDYADLLDRMPDALYFVDGTRKITYWNEAAERITGYRAEDVVGKGCADNILVHVDAEGESLCKGHCPLQATMEDGRFRKAEVYLHHKQGHRLPVLVRVIPLRDDRGRVVGGAEFFSDNSFREGVLARLKELEQLAMLDALTQLANRRFIESEIETRLQEMQRCAIPFGLLLMDIDHFKRFNDDYGHNIGDLALKTVADTLRSVARPYDLVGRWGGEEFVAVVRNVDQALLVKIGERMRRLIAKTGIHVGAEEIGVTVSVGASVAKPDDTPESLFKRTDGFMYRSKERGRNCLTAEM